MIKIFPKYISGGRNMKKEATEVLDENDMEVVRVLTELGVPKNSAKTLMFLSQKGQTKSTEIEQGAKLRQPEVSVAMDYLHKKGNWIKKEEERKEGKGRPIHLYKLAVPISEIVKTLEEDGRTKIKEIEQNIKKLKEYLK